MMLSLQVPDTCDLHQLKRIMEEDAQKEKGFKAYNILPLETPGVANVFHNFPEVNIMIGNDILFTSLGSIPFLLSLQHETVFDGVLLTLVVY